MKQRTALEATAMWPVSRPHIRRRFLDALRPDGAFVPLELSLVDVVADLDPGMIDWERGVATDRRLGRAPNQRCS